MNQQKAKGDESTDKIYLSSCTLAPTLRAPHEAPSTCPTLSSIGRRRITTTVICKDHFLEAPDSLFEVCSPMLNVFSARIRLENAGNSPKCFAWEWDLKADQQILDECLFLNGRR